MLDLLQKKIVLVKCSYNFQIFWNSFFDLLTHGKEQPKDDLTTSNILT